MMNISCFCLRLVVAASLLSGLSACAALGMGASGPLSEQRARQALTLNVSTKADVARHMGAATVNAFPSGYEVWVYNEKPGLPTFLEYLPAVGQLASAVNATVHERELAILFDKDGIVRKYRLREAASQLEGLMAR